MCWTRPFCLSVCTSSGPAREHERRAVSEFASETLGRPPAAGAGAHGSQGSCATTASFASTKIGELSFAGPAGSTTFTGAAAIGCLRGRGRGGFFPVFDAATCGCCGSRGDRPWLSCASVQQIWAMERHVACRNSGAASLVRTVGLGSALPALGPLLLVRLGWGHCKSRRTPSLRTR